MKNIFYLLLLLMLVCCSRAPKHDVKKAPSQKLITKNSSDTDDEKVFRYTDQQLESYLDSVGQLPTKPLADKVAFEADSVFKSQKVLDTLISLSDIKILKHAIQKGVMSVKTARRIFNNNQISYDCNTKSVFLTYRVGLIPIVYYPFNIEKGEYGICIGDPDHCENSYLYFFKDNRVIARHDLYQRYSGKLSWFKNTDDETIVYYVKMFEEGTGLGWFNYYFYKYDGNKLIPIVNELQNANLMQPSPVNWGLREVWLESFIQKTNPLTIKMVYYQQFYNGIERDSDLSKDNAFPKIVNDSTIVQYIWDEKTKTFQGQYGLSKISKPQILSYYLTENELLFINAYYKTLKLALLEKEKRKAVLNYLNEIKNHYSKKK